MLADLLFPAGFHGTSGPITVCDSIPSPKITTALLDAARERGYRVGDLNGATQTGIVYIDTHRRLIVIVKYAFIQIEK